MTKRRPKTLAQIKADPRVSYAEKEYDEGEASYWVGLKDGWTLVGDRHNHTIHEDTIKAVIDQFNLEPCDCASCSANGGR